MRKKTVSSLKIMLITLLMFTLLEGFFSIQTYAQETIKPNTAKNVILLIGDGMGLGQIEIARQFEYGRTGIMNIERMEHTALMRTYSADNFVTDSAAGGSAIATGIKTKNESIGVDSAGRQVDSILDAFKQNGKKTGIISNNMVVDATPAAFGSSVANRWENAADIARQLYDNKIDVIMGGGADYFSTEKQNGMDLLSDFKKEGYEIVTDENEMKSIKNPAKLLGLFHPTYMNFKQDKEILSSSEPSLNQMTAKALEVLSRDDTGFFLMVEGARIDHASHAADIPGIWKETIEFDSTVGDVLKWAGKRNDTLVIVLADHETMGISATEQMDVTSLKKIKVSPAYMAAKLEWDGRTKINPKKIINLFKIYANIDLTKQEAKQFIHDVKEKATVYPKNKVSWEIGSLISKYYRAGVTDRSVRQGSSTGGHTANMIPVFAEGPGSAVFHGVIDNTDISRRIAKGANIQFSPGKVIKGEEEK